MRILCDTVHLFVNAISSGLHLVIASAFGLFLACPHVRGDNPRALASGLSYVQVGKHGLTILNHVHPCRPGTARDISC